MNYVYNVFIEYGTSAWAILGLLLLLIEIMSGLFAFLSFGLAALITSGLMYVIGWPETSVEQIVFFATSGILVAAILVPYGKKKTVGVGSITTGDFGYVLKNAPDAQVTGISDDGKSGMVKFSAAFMGSRKWMFESEEQVNISDPVKVISMRGNAVIVRKVQ